MTTPSDICTQALKKAGVLGVGQSALAEDINDAYTDLQDMLGQWQRKRWLIWHLVDYSITSTGAQSYTVGPGGNFDVATRPDRIESAFTRIQPGGGQPVDCPLTIIQSREQYNRIALKSLTSWPVAAFYDSAFPIGNLFPWPIPQASLYQIHISLKEQLSQFTSLGQTISLPLEYMAALKFCLTQRLRQSYQLPPDPELNALAKDALAVIRGANAQIPTLTMPKDLTRYNFYANQYY